LAVARRGKPHTDRGSHFVIMFVLFGIVCLFVLAGVITVHDGVRGKL
jgi:hypothetical protein